MQMPGACLFVPPVALFGRAWWNLSCDAMSQGWAGECQVSPRKQIKGRKKETCQNVSKVGCSTG